MKNTLMIVIVILFSNTIFAQQKQKLDTSIGFIDKDGKITYYVYPHSCEKCRIKYPAKKTNDPLELPIEFLTIKKVDNA
jgi:uncharacterized membrane protein (UPF0127 family)